MAWTTEEAADYLGVTKNMVARLCRDDVLTATKHGRDWDIDPESVVVYKISPKNKGGRPRKKPVPSPSHTPIDKE